MKSTTLFSLMIVISAVATTGVAEEKTPAGIDYIRDIRPILAANCFACHGTDESHREAGLRLDTRDSAVAKLESDEIAIVPGQPKKSALYRRIVTDDESTKMPPGDSGKQLTEEQIETLKRWISEGADYAEHWSFAKPRRPALPRVQNTSWPRNGLDYFVLAQLEKRGLRPSPEADRYAIIRRLSLDLRGLPPTREEVQDFVNDRSPQAYEKLVDLFLADTAFGERWSRMWLDLARYADSRGYGSDPLRPNIWRYRDWVIDAFNRNLPFDRFTIEQLGGDLLPNPTLDQKIATAFHRNTMTNTEGGTDDEEFRVAAVRDRVDTTMQAWMGLTMGCAKCHSHKYDPISQKEYYQFYAFFNQTADRDLPSEAPVIPAPTQLMLAETETINARIATLKRQLGTPTPQLAAAQIQWESGFHSRSDWQILNPTGMQAKSGAILSKLDDASLLASGPNPKQETYTVHAITDASNITAIRLEALPHESLPAGSSGRGIDGRFVLSQLQVAAVDIEKRGQPLSGRFVRITLPGKQRILHLAEVQVFSGGENIAVTGTAKQSSTGHNAPAGLAIDGNTNGDFFTGKSTTHNNTEDNPWWEVDLKSVKPIDQIIVWNRTDGNVGSRTANFEIAVFSKAASTNPRKAIWRQRIAQQPNPSFAASPNGQSSVPLGAAFADAEQKGFAVRTAVSAKDITTAGWSIGPKQKQARSAYFVFSKPLSLGTQTELTLTLKHVHKSGPSALGRFRFSVTNDPNVRRRLSVPANVLVMIDVPREQRTRVQQQQLADYFRSMAAALQPIRDEVARLQKAKPKFPTVPVMQELPPAAHRKTRVMVKGNFLVTSDEVTAGVPAAFHAMKETAPKNRLGMAQWLVDPENPLTARVAVNRFWAKLFSAGIVVTEEDFGTQGEPPSHPRLLDWLAMEFMGPLEWDTKALLRTIVTSATYRQTSRVTDELLEIDPLNRWLTRGPRFRLEAEMVRDQVLSLSGLLSRKLFGPSVYPPQPPGLWRAAFNGQRKWPTSNGADRYRRGLYTFWRRTIPYPSMATFDAPSRELCSIRRIRTNTPLQAFVTLNDPVYVEAAQALARRIFQEGGTTTEDRARYALELCLVRKPNSQHVARIVALYESEVDHYGKHRDAAGSIATEPLGPLPNNMPLTELAAWTVVSNVLLNLDGVLMK